MGRQKSIKRSANQEAWAEIDSFEGEKGNVICTPGRLYRHVNYRRMRPSAKAVLWDIVAEYDGTNNGYLSAEWNKMQDCGWGSEHTVREAIAELLHYGWLVKTQIGGRDHRPNLYGITWRKLNQRQGKLLPIPADCDYSRPLATYRGEKEKYTKAKPVAANDAAANQAEDAA